MSIRRRQFLQISGVTSLGTISGIPSFAHIFNILPDEERESISVLGIFPDPNSILEEGIHLRWSLPSSKGIPNIINIYKRQYSGLSQNRIINPANSGKITLPKNYEDIYFNGAVDKLKLLKKPGGDSYIINSVSNNDLIRISFKDQINYCKINIGENDNFQLKVVLDNSKEIFINIKANIKSNILVDTNTSKSIKYIELPLRFKNFYSIELITKSNDCHGSGWDFIGNIENQNDLNDPEFNAIFYRLYGGNPKLNYYLKNIADPRINYKGYAIKIGLLMKGLRDPDPKDFYLEDDFQNLFQTPINQLKLKASSSENFNINAWNLLMMQSIDPNIARMMGLYFVDLKAKKGELVDYKIEAIYNNGLSICGIVNGVGGTHTPKPLIANALSRISTNDSTWWEFDDNFNPSQYGNILLRWEDKIQNPNNELWKRFIEPVVFELKSNDNASRLIVPEKDKNGIYKFKDRRIQTGAISYSIKGIDIWGQETGTISKIVNLLDNDTPPPPYRLRFKTELIQSEQASQREKVFLEFNYGPSQFLKDPKPHHHNLYVKSGNLFAENKEIKYNNVISLGKNEDGNPIFELFIEEPIIADNFKSLSFIKDYSGNSLRASLKREFNIEATENNSIIFASSNDYHPARNGMILLKIDERKKTLGWIKQPTMLNPLNPLYLTSRLETYTHFNKSDNFGDQIHYSGESPNSNCFTAKIRSISHKSLNDNPDLFEKRSLPDEEAFYTEIAIDRSIAQAGVFVDWKVAMHNQIYIIVGQSAGVANATQDNKKTYLIIKGHVTATTNSEIFLMPPTKDSDENVIIRNEYIFRLKDYHNSILSNTIGEILLYGNLKYKNNLGKLVNRRINVVGEILSDFYVKGNTLEVLVRINIGKQGFTLIDNSKVLFFPSNRTEITSLISNPLSSETYKFTHFALDTTDNENKVSTLSTIAQISKANSAKPATPSRPFACENSNELEYYVKLPDSKGNSIFCLKWDSPIGLHGLRYDVGRVLDKVLLGEHNKMWLKGSQTSNHNELNVYDENMRVNGLMLSSITSLSKGSFEVTFSAEYIPDNDLLNSYLEGRFFQAESNQNKFFKVLKIWKENNSVHVIMKPVVPEYVPINAAFIIDVLPLVDGKLLYYEALLADSNRLIEIANRYPNAFSKVTMNPLRNRNTYEDQVSSRGDGRYFYKVKAVDEAGNESDWSPSSVPVWKVDNGAPEALIEFNVEIGDRMARLVWRNLKLPKLVTHIDIFRSETELNEETDYYNLAPYRTILKDQVVIKSVVARNGKITLPHVVKLAIPSGNNEINERISQLIAVTNFDIHYIDSPSINIFDSAKFEIIYEKAENDTTILIKGLKAKVQDLITSKDIVVDDRPLIVTIGTTTFDKDLSFNMFEDILVEGGKTYYYAIRAVKTLPNTKFKKGIVSSPIKIISIDRSIPSPPTINNISWVKQGLVSEVFTENSSPIFNISSQDIPVSVLIQKLKTGTLKWENCKIGIEKGWVDWPENGYLVEDFLYDSKGYTFRASIKLRNNKISPYSAIKLI